MRLIVERNHLLAALTRTAGVVGKRSTIEILRHVRVETFATHISLTCTNLDIQATINVPARIETVGSTTVAAERLREICARLPEGAEIVIDGTDPSRATIKAGRSKFSIGALPSKDFPLLTEPEGGAVLEMAAGAMLRLLTIGADRMGESARSLDCCYLSTAGGNIRAVSSDIPTLTLCEVPAPKDFKLPKGVKIKDDTVAVLLKALSAMKPDDAASLTLLPGKMLAASLGGMDIVARVLDGEPVQYDRVIPTPSDKVLTAYTDDFVAMIRRAMISDPYVEIELRDGKMEIRSRDQNTGDASQEEAETDWAGEDRLISIKGALLLGVLEHVETECAIIQVDDAIGPLRVTASPASDWLGLCMQARGSK